ncbi:hypothetical protein EYF80_054093 [Liparis tanakae]|uniref:Uncharacterized protein n=1 Tax=Liparis tanakae TaxID=230148 RepID=A0A4Z2F4R4_9TELE|nr:hypothetical protein EYF80_054093 [Liparis tanakae]
MVLSPELAERMLPSISESRICADTKGPQKDLWTSIGYPLARHDMASSRLPQGFSNCRARPSSGAQWYYSFDARRPSDPRASIYNKTTLPQAYLAGSSKMPRNSESRVVAHAEA